MKRFLTLFACAAATLINAVAAPVTMHDVPDSTPLLDSSDPFGFNYKFTLNGIEYYWTNQPNITVSGQIAGGYVSSVNNATGAVSVATVAQGVKADAAVPRQNGASTNQTLMTASVPTYITFATNSVGTLTAGQISWDSDWLTFKFGLGNGVQGQAFQEGQVVAKNVWTNTIPDGWVVMHSGAVGNSGKFEVVPAISTVGMRHGAVLGMATEDIPIGAMGRITKFGNVNAIGSDGSLYGSSGWVDNSPVYLSHTHPGWVSTNSPPPPFSSILVGNVINSHSSGAIYVDVKCGQSLADLDDVNGTPLTTSGQFPVYNAETGVFDFTGNTNRFVAEETDAIALSALATNKTFVLHDTLSDYIVRIVNGTGTVYTVTQVSESFSVSLSPDFSSASEQARPAWTNNVFPFFDTGWRGEFLNEVTPRITYNESTWIPLTDPPFSYPLTLEPGVGNGYAVITQTLAHATTNYSHTFVTSTDRANDLATIRSEIAASTNAVDSNLQPYSQTFYGDLLTTNTAGYAGFLTSNGVQNIHVVVPINVAQTNTAQFIYPFSGDRVDYASCVTYAQLGGASTLATATLTAYDGETAFASNTVSAIGGVASGYRAYFTNVLYAAGRVITNGSMRLTVTLGKGAAVPAAIIATGGDTPMILTASRYPLPYATMNDIATRADLYGQNNFLGTNYFVGPVIITNASVGANNASLIVRNMNPYASPFTQRSQVWQDSTGAEVAYMRTDGALVCSAKPIQGSGLLSSTAGSASSVSIGYSQANSGFYFPSVSTMGLAVNATPRLTFLANNTVLSNTPLYVANNVAVSNLTFHVPRWIDEKITGGSVLANPSAAPSRVEAGGTGSGVYGIGWSTGDDASFVLQLAHGMAETNSFFPNFYYDPHIHVSSTATAGGADKATFVMKWQIGALNDSYNGTLARTNTVTFAAANTHYVLDFGVVTNNALQGRDSVIARGTLYRIAGTDDVGADVAIMDSLDFHIPVREYGSANINGDTP